MLYSKLDLLPSGDGRVDRDHWSVSSFQSLSALRDASSAAFEYCHAHGAARFRA
jgi:hypothetical protein